MPLINFCAKGFSFICIHQNLLMHIRFNEKKTEIASRIGDWDVRFDLGQMRQINVASGFSRPIRCSVKMSIYFFSF